MGLDHGFIHKRKGQEQKDYTFRKANHIHKYIIDTFHGGVDDQKDFKVPVSGIIDFRDSLIKVINTLEAGDTHLASKLLPTEPGFFFGGLEYDEYYLNDCKEALKMCDEILASKPKGTVTYWCWW